MDQGYWVFEYVKVMLAYLFVIYMWPGVVFRRHLAGKGRAYRFCFCVNVSILLINTVVLFLGLIKLLYQPIIWAIFWGVFIVQLIRNYDLGLSRFKDIKSVLKKTMSFKRMLLKWHDFNAEKLRSAWNKWWSSTEGRRLEYALLLLIVAFATAYFSINALEVHSYGATDQYVHHEWIYGLTQGSIFPRGIYPAGMHCLIYLMGTVLPVNLYSSMLYLAGVHIHTYILSAYLLGRKLFGWRMSAMFALVGFLTIEQVIANAIVSVARLSWTLPQEFGLYVVFMSAYALIGFFRQTPEPKREKFRFFRISSWRRFLSDRYLFIFITSIASSICAHFYATIIAAFACIVVAAVYVCRLFRRGVFLRLVAASLLALFIAAAPMIAAFIEGYPLDGSLYWAMNVTNGKLAESRSANKIATPDQTEIAAATEEPEQDDEESASASEQILEKVKRFIKGTYITVYKEQRGIILLVTNIAVAGFAALILMIQGLIRRIRKRRGKPPGKFLFAAPEGYLIAALSVVFLFATYRPKTFGLPTLVEGPRLFSTIDMFTMFLYACVLDVVFTLLKPLLKERFLKPLSVAVCAGIYAFAQMTGIFHGYLNCNLTRYPIAVELTKEIVSEMPKYKYTIISTTDEIYQVIETGYHEEWIDFMEKRNNTTYTIPTPYLFFFIEKHPLHYVQYTFAYGPEWLAAEKYPKVFGGYSSQYPEILHGEVSEESAVQPLSYGKLRSDTAAIFSKRIILESKAYAWYLKFSKMYPNDGEVIYEDDDFLCYCVRQNEFSLFSLGIMNDIQEGRRQ